MTSNVLDILTSAPTLIASENLKVIAAQETLARAKHALDVAKAAATIKYKDEKNATLTKAYVTLDPDVQEKELQVIALDAQKEIAQTKANKISDEFISARKLAGLDDRELMAIRGSTISEGDRNKHNQ